MDVLDTHFIDLSHIDTVEQFEELEYSKKVLAIYSKLKYLSKEHRGFIVRIIEDINCEDTLIDIFHRIIVDIENSGLL
jgi:hypothetical protein